VDAQFAILPVTASLRVPKSPVKLKKSGASRFTVKLKVTSRDKATTTVLPGPLTVDGTAGVRVVSGPTPERQRLTKRKPSATFVWTVEALSAGNARFASWAILSTGERTADTSAAVAVVVPGSAEPQSGDEPEEVEAPELLETDSPAG
jgi:hypothetical protein